MMNDLNKAEAVDLCLDTSETRTIEKYDLTFTNTEVVYEHGEGHYDTVCDFMVRRGDEEFRIVLGLGGQEVWKGYLINFFGEHCGKVDLQVVKIETDKVLALRRNNRIALAGKDIYLWSIVEEKEGGYTVYFKLNEEGAEETIALLKYPDEEKSTYTFNGLKITVVKVENEEFAHLLIEEE